jgi:hypothetical protein
MINLAKTLNSLLMESGNRNARYPDKGATYVFRRDFPLLGAEYLTEENITENLFVDFLVPILEQTNENMWFEKRVNLWNFVDHNDRKANYIRKHRHPLQPDIDLLYGNVVDEKRQSPMTGVEIKLFSRFRGPLGALIPKTTSYEGYYAGLDEAISLLTMGVDFVYLWHVQAYPMERLIKSKIKYGDNFFKKNVDENYYITKLGSQFVSTVIRELQLPIGYVNSYLMFVEEEECFSLGIDTRFNVEAELNPIFAENLPSADKESWTSTRTLLRNGLGIEEMKIKTKWFWCSKCTRAFHPRFNFEFCPYCGHKLDSVVL